LKEDFFNDLSYSFHLKETYNWTDQLTEMKLQKYRMYIRFAKKVIFCTAEIWEN